MTGRDTGVSYQRIKHPTRVLCGVAVLFCVGLPTLLMLGSRAYIVQHLSDDAYYYFNIASHVACGEGLSADGLTKTTGFHPLYCFLLAGLRWLTEPSLDGFVRQAIVLNGVCFALTGGVLYWAAKTWWGVAGGVAAALCWWTNPHGVLIGATGLEGAVYGLCLSVSLGMAIWMLRGAEGSVGMGSFLLLGVSLGLTHWARTDSIALLPPLAMVFLSSRSIGDVRRRLMGVGIMCVVAVGMLSVWWWIAYRETGGSLQGSAVVKQLWRAGVRAEHGFWGDMLQAGETWIAYAGKCLVKVPALKWTLSGWLVLLFAGRRLEDGSRTLFLHVLWVLPLGLGVAYALFIDRPRTWYYVPALVCLTLVTAGAFSQIWTGLATNRLAGLARRMMPVLIALVVVESGAVFARNLLHPRSRDQSANLVAVQRLAKNLPMGTRIGCWHSGIMQYYTPNLVVINLDGLANNDIVAVLRGGKTMNAYWDEMGIEYILGQPRRKMGGYTNAWGNKQLDFFANGVQRIVTIDADNEAGSR